MVSFMEVFDQESSSSAKGLMAIVDIGHIWSPLVNIGYLMFLDVSPASYCNICNLPMAPWQVSSPWLPQCLQSKRRSSPSSKRRDPAPYTGVGRATDLHTPRTEIGKGGKEHTGNPIAHIFSTAYGNHMISYDHKQLVDVLLLVILSWYERKRKSKICIEIWIRFGPILVLCCRRFQWKPVVLGVHLRKRERSTVAFENGQHAV